MAGGPLVVNKSFLIAWLGIHRDPGRLLTPLPFGGLISAPHTPGWIETVRTVVVPAIIGAGAALIAVSGRVRRIEPWILLVNVLLVVVLLQAQSYTDISTAGE